MKSLLIAASLATALIGMAVPAAAQDRREGVTRTTTTTERARDGGSVERHVETRRVTSRSVRHAGWGARRCHNVRRHHRWVRVCHHR
ncbi:hypothetical protein [Sphingomonas asaccharolytica]|uniref:hypothetical protein n=1 Tax=Sphingomonas asaccharolytica TaxID=40681 RepID=UPI000B34003F|nr:hypothetical protein [Sphingomonas asaccharolytica]